MARPHRSNHDIVTVEVDLVHETEKAWLVDSGDGDEVWVPKSMCELTRLRYGVYELEGPERFLTQKGLT